MLNRVNGEKRAANVPLVPFCKDETEKKGVRFLLKHGEVAEMPALISCLMITQQGISLLAGGQM